MPLVRQAGCPDVAGGSARGRMSGKGRTAVDPTAEFRMVRTGGKRFLSARRTAVKWSRRKRLSGVQLAIGSAIGSKCRATRTGRSAAANCGAYVSKHSCCWFNSPKIAIVSDRFTASDVSKPSVNASEDDGKKPARLSVLKKIGPPLV